MGAKMIDDFLQSDHDSLSELLKKVEDSLENRELSHAYGKLDLFWARLATHIRAENLCLFPAILAAPAERFARNAVPSVPEVRIVISELRRDHNFFMDELIVSIKSLRAQLATSEASDMVSKEVLQRLVAVKQRLESHNHLEEEQVYRWPSVLLSDSELVNLELEIRHQVQNLPPRFSVENPTAEKRAK
jgi:iron-sulfur cluster repair protein YtfE (RIC family)